METKELLKLKPELKKFLKRFNDCIKTEPSREHLETYVSGQLGDLERKSTEPIALEAGIPPRTLQGFLSVHCWDDERVSKRVIEIVSSDHSAEGAIGVIDESGFPKKGNKTPGVQRQYCGQTGKTDNCVVTVNLGYVVNDFHCLVVSDLYLPKSWIEDEVRRREAKIPDTIIFRTKVEIALDLLRRALAEGLKMTWITADEFYGRSSDFRRKVGEMGLRYVVEIPCSIQGWTGRKARSNREARRVDKLWHRGGPSWQLYRVKDTGRGPEVWNVRVTRFFPREDNHLGNECWLIVSENVISGEVKYFLSNAPSDARVEAILKVGFNRWHIERIFQDGKGEVGMGHFEVRKYKALKRHLILTMLSFLFIARSTEKLRNGKKTLLFVK